MNHDEEERQKRAVDRYEAAERRERRAVWAFWIIAAIFGSLLLFRGCMNALGPAAPF